MTRLPPGGAPPRGVWGAVAEWLKAHAWKACLGETLTWVRIPLSPPHSPSHGPENRYAAHEIVDLDCTAAPQQFFHQAFLIDDNQETPVFLNELLHGHNLHR